MPTRKPRPQSVQKLAALLRHQKTDKKPVDPGTAAAPANTSRNSRPKSLQKFAAILRRKPNAAAAEKSEEIQQENLAVVRLFDNAESQKEDAKNVKTAAENNEVIYDVPRKINSEDVDENENIKEDNTENENTKEDQTENENSKNHDTENENIKDKAKKDVNELFEKNNRESSDEYEEEDEDEEDEKKDDEAVKPRRCIVLPDNFSNTPHARTSVV